MRKSFSVSFLAALALSLLGCGGGGDGAFVQPGAGATPPVGLLTLTTSTPTLPTDGSLSADLRVFVQDSKNVAMEGVTVTFSSTGGILNVTKGVTGADGIATATL